MFVIRFAYSPFGAIAATSFALEMLPGAGYAYTADQEQACTGDAFRLCSADIPDVDRITACMIRNKSQLTPGCRAFFKGPEAAATPVAAGKPLSIRPANAGKGVSAKPRTPKKPANPGAT